MPHSAGFAGAAEAAPCTALAASGPGHLEQPLLWTLCEYGREGPEGVQHPALQGALAGAQAPQLRPASACAGLPAWRAGGRQAGMRGTAAAGCAGGWPHPGQALGRMPEGGGQPGAPRGCEPGPVPYGPMRWPQRAAAARAARQAAAAPAAPTLPPGSLQPRPRKPRRGRAVLAAGLNRRMHGADDACFWYQATWLYTTFGCCGLTTQVFWSRGLHHPVLHCVKHC